MFPTPLRGYVMGDTRMVKRDTLQTRAIIGGVAALVVAGIVWEVAIVSTPSVSSGSPALPTVSGMTLDAGSLVAGEQLTLTGRNLGDVTEVSFADVPATELEVVDDRTIVATVPAVANFQPATVDVAVYVGSTRVQAAAPLTYSYSPQTAIDAQMQYLLTHWNNYNTAQFGDLNSIGGDCMNFVSQSLLARGWAMTSEWYSADAGADWGDAWGHVPSFDEWLRGHPEYGASTLGFDQRDQVKIGDLVVFDWDNDGSLDHIQVVSAIAVDDGVTSIAMVGHNTDSDYRDLDLTLTVDHPGASGYFWSIP